MENQKPYYMAVVSFVFALIGISHLPLGLIARFIEISYFLAVVGSIASLGSFLALVTGAYSIYKIKKNNLSGMKYAILGVIIPTILITINVIIN